MSDSLQGTRSTRTVNLIIACDLHGDRVVPVDRSPMLIGRSGECDVMVADRKVSSRHCELLQVGAHYVIRDLGSTNGTFVNGRDITEAILHLGDELTLGLTQLVFTNRSTFEKTARLVIGGGGSDAGYVVEVPLEDVERRFFSELQASGPADLTTRVNVLYRLSSALNNVLEVDELLERVIGIVLETIACDRAYIFAVRGGRLYPKVIRRRQGLRDDGGLAVSGTMLAQVLKEGKAVFTRDASADERFREGDSIHRFSIRSALAVPLAVKGRVLGVVYLDRVSVGSAFQHTDLQILALICNHAASNLANAQLFEELRVANGQLRKAKEEILHWNVELEAKVDERTREIEAKTRKIMRLSEQKDELLGMVAHDLRTPLTSLCGFMEVVDQHLELGSPPEGARGDLGVARRIAFEMSDLLNDLLDVARIESGRVTIQRGREEVAPLLAECCRQHQALARSRGLELGADIAPGLPEVRLDRRRIGQVLNNLVHNALKFSRAGDRITVGADVRDDLLHVFVADTGPGIPADELESVFGRYVQTETGQQAGHNGAGLGLAIARKLVRLHGGRIWVEAQPEGGARFIFTLPLEL